jgi:hypothetical protein
MLRVSLLASLCIVVGTWQEVGAAPTPKDAMVLRVLVLTGAPTREYQFLRSFLLREQEKKRVEVHFHLQPGPGDRDRVDSPETGLLAQFPDRLKADQDKPDEKSLALETYDVLIAVDPDWMKLREAQRKLVAQWVGQGGGMIVLAGPIHTFDLSRPATREPLKAIEALYPVKLDDIRLNERDAQKAWRLHFGKTTREMPFLKLNPEGQGPLAGWEEFFRGENKVEGENDKPLAHGFYSIYPVRSVKAGARVLATFADPTAAISDKKEQPYLVAWAHEKGQVFYISSGEIWRLRQFREAYYERFWMELIRFVSHGGGEVKKEE